MDICLLLRQAYYAISSHAHAPRFVQTVKLVLKENRTHAGR